MNEESTSICNSEGSTRPLNDLAVTDEMAWAMVDASPDALVMVNHDGLIELVNQQAEVLFGHNRVELLGRPVETLLPKQLEAVHRAHRTRYRAAPTVRSMGEGMELWARRADGSDVPVEISLSPVEIAGRTLVLAAVRDISSRRAAAAETQRLRGAIDSVGDGVAMIDAESLRFVYANSGMARLTGFEAHEILTMTPLHFDPVSTRAEVEQRIAQLVDGTVSQIRAETTLRPKSGIDVPVETVLEYPEVGRDQQRLLVLLVRDISERVAAEEHARLVQHSIDSVTDAVFMCDETTLEFTYVNQGAVDMHGYSRDELLGGMTPIDLAPELPAGELQAALARLGVASHESVRMRTTGRRKDGSTVPVDVEINWPPAGRDGVARPVMAVVRDVTDQVEAERAVRASEARFRAAFDEGPVPMTIVEVTPPDGRTIIDLNEALADLYGYTREELLGRAAADLVHPDNVQPDSKQAQAVAAGGEVDYDQLIRGIKKDGTEVWLQRHISALSPNEEQDKLIVHVLDVTAEIESETALRRQQAITAALSEVRLVMLQGATRKHGLNLLCETAAELLDASGAVVLTPTGEDDHVQVEASAGVPETVAARMRFRTTQGGVGQVFQTGEAVHTPEMRHSTTPDANREILNEQRVGPILMAPMPVGDQTAGVLAIVRLTGQAPFNDRDVDAAEQFASSAGVAIELAQARTNEAALQLLEDRERIGRDIHDNVISKLFATGMKIQAATGRLTDRDLEQRLISSVDDIDDAIKDIRTAIYGVRSRTEWGRGVRGEILALAANQNDTLGFEPTVRLDGPIDELPTNLVVEMLAVAREALTNATKYAKATTVDLTVTCTTTRLNLEIRDNGIGFDTQDQSAHHSGQEHSGNGLSNMVNRARALGGQASITSNPGIGTTVTWAVPVP